MASIGWIDFSPEHRNRVGTVLDLLKPEGMVDELGMGTIRDAIANELFPGISTIQTRAKYFFIVPYILYDFQNLKPIQRKGKNVVKFLEQKEYEVMWDLGDHYRALALDQKTRESFGVIGNTKNIRSKDFIVRRPSAIYWNGLNTYQFIKTGGLSAETFLKQMVNPNIESLLSSEVKSDDANSDDADSDHQNMFKLKVPFMKKWNENLTLELTKDESEFFADRVISISKNKLIAELLLNEDLWSVFIAASNFMEFSKAAISLNLSSELKSMLILAHDFSEVMYGAHLAYNCQLHHKVFNSNHHDATWNDWLANIQTNMLDYHNFNPDKIFSYALTTKSSTMDFVKTWWQQTQLGFLDLNLRDNLIEKQEAIVKGSKARIRYKKTDDVKENYWQGLTYFDYRYNQGKTILKDIKSGLTK